MATKYKKNYRGVFDTLVWDGTYNPNGTKHRIHITSEKSSRDLELKVQEHQDRLKNNNVTVYSDMTLHSYAVEWLNTSKSARELNTQRMYENIINVHLQPCGHVLLSNFSHSNFQQLINYQLDHPRTCQQIYLTVRQIIKSAIKDRILPRSAFDDICGDISLPKYKKPEKRPLSALEKEAFEKVELDDRKQAFISILYYFGLRRGEALALTPSDFDWKEKELSISKVIIFGKNGVPSLKDYPKSDNGIRTIPIPDKAIPRIKPFVDTCEGFIFHGQNTDMMTLSAFTRMWESIIVSMNISAGYNPNAKKEKSEKKITNLTPHIFRHNYCTELCYQIPTISTKMIARLLGDNEKMVLDVYSHINESKENIKSAVNCF